MDLLDSWSAWMQAQGLSARTISERTSTIRTMLRHAGVGGLEITPAHIITFMGRKMKPATRATYHASIRAFCAWMQRTGRRPDNPADATPRPRRPRSVPRPLSDAQIAALLLAVRRRRTRTYVLLALLAGLRVHEIAKIRGEDIDRYDHTIRVIGKGGSVAVLPLHETLVDELRDYPSEGWIFQSYVNDGPVGPHAVSLAIRDAMRRAGINATPHQLRHSYGTALVRGGVNMRVVQQLLRHLSLASSAIYTEVDDDQLRAGVDQLSLPTAA